MPDLFDITHGAGGLWEIHTWNSALALNAAQVDEEDDPVVDRIIVTRITGLHSLPERADPRASKVGRIGEFAYPTSWLGKTVVYEGLIQASSTASLRLQRAALLAAFSDPALEGQMDIDIAGDVGGPPSRFYAKPMQLDVVDEIPSDGAPFNRVFTLGLRLSDPRIYFPSLEVSGPGASVVNPGTAPADPIITVAGASGDVVVSDGSRTLTFVNCPSGSLVIDFAARAAQVGSTLVELVPATSDWWDSHVPGIAGGATVAITQSGGSSVAVTFLPADW